MTSRNLIISLISLALSLFITGYNIGGMQIGGWDSTKSVTRNTNGNNDFALAKQESLDFFNDISSSHWKLLKDKVKWQAPNYNTWCLPRFDVNGKLRGDNRQLQTGFFYQNHYEPDFVCQHERRIGKLGDGGKWICDPHRISQQKECLVYSVGSNNDFSFEEYVYKEIGAHCEIHTFDFGNYAQGAEKAGVHYHQVGVGLDDPDRNFKSIATLARELGHEGRTIDIFKIDCEGCEWATAKHWFEADVTLRQIQVELHKVDIKKTPQFFDLMYQNNYVITHKEANIAYPGSIEYAFLQLSPEFSKGIERPNAAMPE